MPATVAYWIVTGLALYGGIGLVFALAFVARGAARIDPDAAGATLGFRVLILPGAAALWPWMLLRWRSADGSREEKSAHRVAAREHDK